MAQVKKLSGGGNPSNKYLMFNGTKIVEGDNNFKQLEQQALNGNRAAQSMLSTLRADNYDNSMVVNTSDNGVDFQNVDMNYYNDRTGKQFEKGDSWWRRNVSRTREGKDYIKDFIELRFAAPAAEEKASSSDLDKLTKASRLFLYKDGKYDAYNVDNASHEQAVRDIARYFSYGNKDEAAKYFDTSDLGNVDALWTIYNNAKAAGENIDFEKFIRDIRSERRSNDWDDPTFRLLQNFGFMGYDPNSQEEIDIRNAAKLKDLGFDTDKAKDVLTFDKDGNLVLTQDFMNSFGTEFGNKKGNYWFNDQFAEMSVNGAENPYTWLNGWTAIGGKLYKNDDPAVQNFLINSGYIDKNKQSLYNDANDIMQSLWGNQIQFDKYSPDNFHSNWAKDKKGLRYRGISGYDIGKDELGRDNQLVEYYDDSDARDAYGYVTTPRYAILNGNGDFVKDVNLNDLVLTADAPGSVEVTMNEILDQSQGKHFAGKYQELFQGNNGLSDLRVFTDPKTGETFIQDSDLKGNQRGKAVVLPKELAKTIKDSKWFEYISKNKGAKERFYKSLQQLTSSAVGDFLTSGNISDWWFGARKNLLKRDFINAGYSPEEATEFANMMEKWTRNTRSAFRELGTLPGQSTRENYVLREPIKVGEFKEGGKIEKHAIGDLIGESKGTKGETKVNKVEGNKETIKQAWGLGSKDSKQFSDADWMDLSAMVADLGALGITLVDPTNIGGAIAGLTGSTATFAADVKRNGFQLGDLGTYGLNLVMDAATLLPVLGDAVSGAKAVRTLKKAAPLLSKAIKAGAIVGIGDAAINTIDKIAKGESFTISDARRLINGLSSGVTLKRTGLLTPKTKSFSVPELTIKSKNKDVADIKLTKDEIKQIGDISSDEQIAEVVKIISKRTGKSANEIKDLFDIDSIVKTVKRPQWKFWKGLNEKSKINIPKEKSTRRLMTDAEIREKAKDRNGFQNWFYGTGNEQRVYNSWLRNFEKPSFKNEITIKGSPSKGGYWETNLKLAEPKVINANKSWIPKRIWAPGTPSEPAHFTGNIDTGDLRWVSKTNAIPGKWLPAKYGTLNKIKFNNPVPGVPDKTLTSVHTSPFKPSFFSMLPISSITPWWQVSGNTIPEEIYYPGTEPVYEFKQGGILKAQPGAHLSLGYTAPTFKPTGTTWTPALGKSPVVANQKMDLSQYTQAPTTTTKPSWTPDADKIVSNTTSKLNNAVSDVNSKMSAAGIAPTTQSGNDSVNYSGGTSGGGSLGNEIDPYKTGYFASLAKQFNRAGQDNKKFLNSGLDLAEARGQYLTQYRNHPSYKASYTWLNKYDSDINNVYDRAAQQGALTTNANTNAALFAQANNSATQLAIARNNQLGNEISQNREKQYQIADKNAAYDWETDKQRNNELFTSEYMKKQAEQAYLTRESDRMNKAEHLGQQLLTKEAKAAYQPRIQEDTIRRQMALSKIQNPDADLSQLQDYLEYVKSDENKKALSRAAWLAAKGGKLRPTSEQMLLDNQKLVAKAIEKMNDNTMKLILKALS